MTSDSVLTNPNDIGFRQPAACRGVEGWDPDETPGNRPAQDYHDFYSQFIGNDARLSARWRSAWSSDFSLLEIHASLPGHQEFCGGFYSPLMLFFGDQRPAFKQSVDFAVKSYKAPISWPEHSNEHGFLALDVNGDGRIDHGGELFGQANGHENGFAALAVHDLNGDGVIDVRDPVFSQLVVWRDSTGQAISKPSDLVPLRRLGVQSISLRYRSDRTDPIGANAELRERAFFKFNRNGKTRTGEVIDVWLAGP